MLHGGMGGYVMKVVAIELPCGHFVQLRPQLHYAGLLLIPDCLNPIRYANIGSYTAPLRLFLRSVPGIHYILQSCFCQVIASSYMKKERIHLH